MSLVTNLPRFNRQNWTKKIGNFFGHLCHIFGQILGLMLGGSRLFWLKFSPSIADWSLKVRWKRQHKKKIAITETEVLLGQNWPKSAMRASRTWFYVSSRCEMKSRARGSIYLFKMNWCEKFRGSRIYWKSDISHSIPIPVMIPIGEMTLTL